MTIYLDENLSQYIAEALNSLNKGHFPNISVASTKVCFGIGTPDETIIPKIGNENAVLITKDINIRRKQAQFELCQQYNIGIFFIAMPKGGDKHWEVVKLLINNWEDIIQKAERDTKPFAYELKPKSKIKPL
jgi:PIN like domain